MKRLWSWNGNEGNQASLLVGMTAPCLFGAQKRVLNLRNIIFLVTRCSWSVITILLWLGFAKKMLCYSSGLRKDCGYGLIFWNLETQHDSLQHPTELLTILGCLRARIHITLSYFGFRDLFRVCVSVCVCVSVSVLPSLPMSTFTSLRGEHFSETFACLSFRHRLETDSKCVSAMR